MIVRLGYQDWSAVHVEEDRGFPIELPDGLAARLRTTMRDFLAVQQEIRLIVAEEAHHARGWQNRIMLDEWRAAQARQRPERSDRPIRQVGGEVTTQGVGSTDERKDSR